VAICEISTVVQYYNGHDGAFPRKLNRKNFADWPSVKIEPHENFPLYGIPFTVIIAVGSSFSLTPSTTDSVSFLGTSTSL
jgi:hypothetical protein